MIRFKAKSKTIAFVSHRLESSKQLCRRSMLLHEGRIVTAGHTEEVVDRYLVMPEKGPAR